jgi:hypothetical protein
MALTVLPADQPAEEHAFFRVRVERSDLRDLTRTGPDCGSRETTIMCMCSRSYRPKAARRHRSCHNFFAHRIAVIGSSFHSLPHNGAVVPLPAMCGSTRRESYIDMVMEYCWADHCLGGLLSRDRCLDLLSNERTDARLRIGMMPV